MPLENILIRMREILPDLGRKRRRNSSCPDSGPPSKVTKNRQEHRFVRDPSPISKRSTTVQNHVIPKQPFRKSDFLDDDLLRKREDVQKRRTISPVNTMRMKTESSFVCKRHNVDIVKEKYSDAIAQRHGKISQQEETDKKATHDRVKYHNSDENLNLNIEEKIDDFPEFTDAQRQTIRHAMVGSPHTTLISKFKHQITRCDILTLQWEPVLDWLNDEVINFYMNLLMERGEVRANDGYPKVYAMNTFFIPRLFQGGHSAVKRWTKTVDIFACDIIPVPVHVGNVHWCMAMINMKEKTNKYYDSMGAPNQRVLSELEDYLKKESLDKRKIEFDFRGWSKENVTDNPRQDNGSDCGVFSCMTAEFICRNRPVAFNQQHMNYFRQKMVLEISLGSLLL